MALEADKSCAVDLLLCVKSLKHKYFSLTFDLFDRWIA